MSVFISTTPCPSFQKEGTTKCILSSFAPTCSVLHAILSCRDCKMRILVAVSVRELKFVGVEFEKTRNLKLVTQNFFVPLHPEIGLRPFKALRAVQCASRVQCCCAAVQSPAGVQVACGRSKRFVRSRFNAAAQRKNRNFVNSK